MQSPVLVHLALTGAVGLTRSVSDRQGPRLGLQGRGEAGGLPGSDCGKGLLAWALAWRDTSRPARRPCGPRLKEGSSGAWLENKAPVCCLGPRPRGGQSPFQHQP